MSAGRRSRLVLAALRLVWHDRAVPLWAIDLARRLFRTPNALVPGGGVLLTHGRALADPRLAAALADRQFGEWGLTSAVVDHLDERLRDTKPARVLELGSGISTACLAHFLRKVHGSAPTRLVSVDQSAEYQAEAERLLELLDVADVVELHVCPLRAQRFGDALVPTYDFDESLIASLNEHPPDLVLIDGPSAGDMSRYAALRLLHPHLRAGATVLLDDALRDDELAVARRWRDEHLLELDGIRLVGKGLLVGRVARRT